MLSKELFRSADLFSALNDADIDFIMNHSEEKSYQKGDVVFNKGAAAIHFYIVSQGKINITHTDDSGHCTDLAQYVARNSFGEFDFVTSNLYQVEAKALEDSRLILFPAFPHTLEALTQEKSDTVTRIYLRALVVLAGRIRSIHTLISENSSWIKQLQTQLYTDHLTGLFTKNYLETEIPRLLNHPVSFLMIKPDSFKVLNDIYGHKAGDAVLLRISHLLSDIIKQGAKGWAIRLRSNEMALVLQEADKHRALTLAKDISEQISQIGPSQLHEDKNKYNNKVSDFYLTSSMAIGTIETKNDNWKHIYDLTYHLLHQAWKKGGNRILLLKQD